MSSSSRTMFMPSTPYSTVANGKREGFDIPSRRDARHGAPVDDLQQRQQQQHQHQAASRLEHVKLEADEHRQLQNQTTGGGWTLDGVASSRSSSAFGSAHKYSLPYPSLSPFPGTSFAAASASEIDDALSSLVGSFPAGRLFDRPSDLPSFSQAGTAFSFPTSNGQAFQANSNAPLSLNPQSLSIPPTQAPLHKATAHLGGRTSNSNSPNPGGQSSSYSPESALSQNDNLFDTYKAVSSSSEYANGSTGLTGLSYPDSLVSPATSVSLSSCHLGNGPGVQGQNNGSTLRSRSRSSIRDHREAAASAPSTSIGIGGRVRVARRGSFNSEASGMMSPPSAYNPSLPSITGSGTHTRRASAIVIPSAGHEPSNGLGIGFNTGSLPAFGSGQEQAQQQQSTASWVFSPNSDKSELPLVRETQSDDEDIAELKRVDDVVKPADTLAEKRRRRRESHNAVERRRRDTINEKISELSTLIPACMLDPARTSPFSAVEIAAPLCHVGVDLSFTATALIGGGVDDDEDEEPMMSVEDEAKGKGRGKTAKKPAKKKTGGGGGLNAIGPDGKPNKGIVLKKSVEYIRFLHQIIQAQAARNTDLETMLQSAMIQSTPSSSVSQPSVTTSDASDSPVDDYAASQPSFSAVPSQPKQDCMPFPSLHEVLGDSKSSFAAYEGDLNMRSFNLGMSGSGHQSASNFFGTQPSTTQTSSISSPNIFPWSTNPGSPDALQRPDTSGMVSHSTASTSSRRGSEVGDVEERGRGRETRFLNSGGGAGAGGEGWGQSSDLSSSDFRGLDARETFGSLFSSVHGDGRLGRRDDVIME